MKRNELRITRFDRVKETLSHLLGLAILLATIALWGAWGAICYPGNSFALVGWAASGVFMTWLMSPVICYYVLEAMFSTRTMEVNWSDRAIAYGAALRILKTIHALEGGTTALLLAQLARARLWQGHYEMAEKLLKESLLCASKDSRYSGSHGIGALHAWLSDAYFLQDRILEAELEMVKSLEIYDLHKKEVSPLHSTLVVLRLSAVRLTLGELDSAEEQLLGVKQSIEDPNMKVSTGDEWAIPVAVLSCDLNLACLYAQTDRLAESDALCAKSLNSLQHSELLVQYAPTRTINMLLETYVAAGRGQEIEPLLGLVYDRYRNQPYHPEATRTLDCFERLLNATNRSEEVTDMRSWLRPAHKRIEAGQVKP